MSWEAGRKVWHASWLLHAPRHVVCFTPRGMMLSAACSGSDGEVPGSTQVAVAAFFVSFLILAV
jgi:hypothetical protein